MKIITIQRVLEYPGEGTFGVMVYERKPIALTLERNWVCNKRNVSCIPRGMYKVKPYRSRKHGDGFKIYNVPGRSGILIHVGNTIDDTKGCIIPGREPGRLNGKMAVLYSRDAMNHIEHILGLGGKETAWMEIRNEMG